MTYSQQKFEAGEYGPDSLYGRLGDIIKFEMGLHHRVDCCCGLCCETFAKKKMLLEIIAGVEARREELQKNLHEDLPEDSEEAYDMGVEDGEIRALTILLEGEQK